MRISYWSSDVCSSDLEPEDHRHSRGVLRRGASVLLPRRDGRPNDRVAPRGTCAGRQQALLRVLLNRLQPCPAPCRQGVGGQVQGPVRRSEERRVGKEGVSTCRFRGTPAHKKKK